ncbi:MAG TPA: type IVB secretion system protein IcmH/DotU [Stellaceae bacterium]|jgi:type VI secretion system protein ImpK|nr:type IVB secretion system protein IcmH/DotU [Stellaceae bacterium]
MSIDDPFGEPPESERTVIRPNPGGRQPAEVAPAMAEAMPMPAGVAPTPVASPQRPMALVAIKNLNPLVNAALPLLDLAVQFKNRAVHNNIESLRDRVVAEINAFERKITPLGLAPQTLRAARYTLCATIDDIVLNTPWGSRSVWTQRSMVATFHNEVVGGDRFWDLLNQLKRDAAVNLDLLELLYFCITLGFEGKYRVIPRGASELVLVREDLYRLIRNNRGEFERSLSPHWQGVGARFAGVHQRIPNWLVGLIGVGVLAVFYVLFTFLLSGRSDAAYEALNAMPPTTPVTLARAAPALPPPPPPPEEQGIRKFLAPEIQQGLVTVREDAQTVVVNIRSSGMFSSGSADVVPAFLPLLQRIGEALNGEAGAVQVIGHTDNQRIRSLKFPSNFELSLARARAVLAVIKQKVTDGSRLTADGRADSEPIASNATPEGREQNRRIEVVLTRAS